jgi:hypothetical protein
VRTRAYREHQLLPAGRSRQELTPTRLLGYDPRMKIAPFVAVSALAACGGGGKSNDMVTVIDAPMQQVDAPAQAACTAPASFSAASNFLVQYNADTQMMADGNQEAWQTIGRLDMDALTDLLWIELYEGPAPDYTMADFPATPFTIQLTGNELSYATCSTCVTLTTDTDLANSQQSLVYADDYMATAGSVTITTLTNTMIAGTLDNVSFQHVDFSMTGQTPNASGCTTTAASIPFTAMVQMMPPQPNASGRIGYGARIQGLARRPLKLAR